MPISAVEVQTLLEQARRLVEQLEGLKARAEQEELTAGRIGYAAPRLTRKA